MICLGSIIRHRIRFQFGPYRKFFSFELDALLIPLNPGPTDLYRRLAEDLH